MTPKDKKAYKMLDKFARDGIDVSQMRSKLDSKYNVLEGKTRKNTMINKLRQQ
jgi:hypothetical protein